MALFLPAASWAGVRFDGLEMYSLLPVPMYCSLTLEYLAFLGLPILHISELGVKKARYRLRKKLELNEEDSLESIVIKIGE